LTEVNSLSFI